MKDPINIDDILWSEVDLGSKKIYACLAADGNIFVADQLPDHRGNNVKLLVSDHEHGIVVVK